jgi:gamma-glutamylcyclotransferase (GGCT)/AIG2-like uncharacterized protein YtfP
MIVTEIHRIKIMCVTNHPLTIGDGHVHCTVCTYTGGNFRILDYLQDYSGVYTMYQSISRNFESRPDKLETGYSVSIDAYK